MIAPAVLRRQVHLQGPLHAITETLLSIHTPIPTDVAFWEAPTQLAMGHNQTAKGMLRFEKDKASARLARRPGASEGLGSAQGRGRDRRQFHQGRHVHGHRRAALRPEIPRVEDSDAGRSTSRTSWQTPPG